MTRYEPAHRGHPRGRGRLIAGCSGRLAARARARTRRSRPPLRAPPRSAGGRASSCFPSTTTTNAGPADGGHIEAFLDGTDPPRRPGTRVSSSRERRPLVLDTRSDWAPAPSRGARASRATAGRRASSSSSWPRSDPAVIDRHRARGRRRHPRRGPGDRSRGPGRAARVPGAPPRDGRPRGSLARDAPRARVPAPPGQPRRRAWPWPSRSRPRRAAAGSRTPWPRPRPASRRRSAAGQSTSVATRWSSSAAGSSHSPVWTSDGWMIVLDGDDQPVEALGLAEPRDRPGRPGRRRRSARSPRGAAGSSPGRGPARTPPGAPRRARSARRGTAAAGTAGRPRR